MTSLLVNDFYKNEIITTVAISWVINEAIVSIVCARVYLTFFSYIFASVHNTVVLKKRTQYKISDYFTSIVSPNFISYYYRPIIHKTCTNMHKDFQNLQVCALKVWINFKKIIIFK